MISVLLPTRLRPALLAESVRSLRAHAYGKIEILLAVDEDDPTSYTTYKRVLREPRHGYRNLHLYYNRLAMLAEGDWLLVWNDDAIMTTDGWDELISRHKEKFILAPHSVHDPLVTFPVVPRRFADALGHFSLNAHNDTWWEEIAKQLGALKWIDVFVDHRRPDLTNENFDSVFAEREYQTVNFYSAEMVAARRADVEILREAIAGERVSELHV